MLFYAWHDLAQTREQWERYQAWGHDIWRDAPDERQLNTLEQAEAALRSDLSAGIVRAFGTDSGGKVRPISCEVWDSLSISYRRDFTVVGAEGVAVYSGVFVLRHEVVPLLISEHAGRPPGPLVEPETKVRSNEQTSRRGGRTPVYDWDAMWVEVVRLATEDKIKDRPALSKHLLAWFAEQGRAEPGETIFKEKMSKLFMTLGWE